MRVGERLRTLAAIVVRLAALVGDLRPTLDLGHEGRRQRRFALLGRAWHGGVVRLAAAVLLLGLECAGLLLIRLLVCA